MTGPANSSDRSALLALSARVRELEEALAAGGAEVEIIKQGVADLTETLRGLAARHDAETYPPVWWGDPGDETALPEFADLCGWMRRVLIPRFPDSASGLRPCWHRHAQAIEALTQLWHTHEAAWDPESTDPDPRVRWITDTLPDLMGHIATATAGCGSEHRDYDVLPNPDALLPSLGSEVPT